MRIRHSEAQTPQDVAYTKFMYVGDALLFTADANNNKAEENIIDPSGRIVASKRFDGAYTNQFYFYRYDIRGSVTNITDSTGAVVKGYEYDAYGNTVEKGDSQFKNSTKFTGAVQDQGTGLYYMNARHYNPSTGRFLQQDTYTGDPAEPWTQHLYAYAGNNPVNMVDPTGHSFFSALFKSLSNVVKSFSKIPQVRKAVAKVITAATRAVSKAVSASISSASSSKGKKKSSSSKVNTASGKKLSYKTVDKYLLDNGYQKDDEFTGFTEREEYTDWAAGEFQSFTWEKFAKQNGMYTETLGSFIRGCNWIIAAKDVAGILNRFHKELILRENGGGTLVQYHNNINSFQAIDFKSTRTTITSRTVTLIFNPDRNVTYLKAVGRATETVTGFAEPISDGKPHEWDFTEEIYRVCGN